MTSFNAYKPPKPQFEFFHLLARHQVPFMIVGGHAVQFHGYTRNTEDVDLVWLRSPDAASKLAAALTEANAVWISNEHDPQTGHEKLIAVTSSYVEGRHLMMLMTDYGFVDIFDYIPGFPQADVREVYEQSIVADPFRFVSKEWLIKMKQVANRPKDQLDLEQLQRGV